MKSIFKIILVLLSIVIFSELVGYLSRTHFMKKYVTKLDESNKANIDSIASLADISTDAIPKDYSEILHYYQSTDTNNLKFDTTINCRFRNPISKFLYKEKYLIEITRIDTLSQINLKNDIITNFKESEPELFVHYIKDNLGVLITEYNLHQQNQTSKILLTINGIAIQESIKADSIACFFSKINDFSISYGSDSKIDLVASSTAGNVPIEILFCRRKTNLYMVIATPKNINTEFENGLLHDLVIGDHRL